jgi:acyl carrier protein
VPENKAASAAQNDCKEMNVLNEVRTVVDSALQLRGRLRAGDAATPLLGAIPELDSMAVVSLITALEEHFGIAVADDEIEASTFATLGSLAEFVQQKLDA